MVEFLKNKFSNPFVIATIFFCFLIYSGLLPYRERHPYRSIVPIEKTSAVTGTICSNPVKTSSGKFYVFKLKAESAQAFISGLSVTSGAAGILSVGVPASIVESLYPGKLHAASGERILFETGERICVYGKSASFFIAEKVEPLVSSKSFSARISRLRALCRLHFKRLMFGWGKAGGFILALLSGSREYTESSLNEIFRKSGLSHILALSGMHLSFFAFMTGGTGRYFLGKKFDLWFRLAGILFFVWFAGLSPSLFRALLCALVLLVCSAVFCTGIDFFYVLCFVFLVHCCVFPEDIFMPSFILSYGSLTGILLFNDFFKSLLTGCMPGRIADGFSTSAAAQTVAMPLTMIIFRTFSPVGIIASVVVSPMVSIFLFLSSVAIIISFVIPFLSPVLGNLLNFLYMIIMASAGFFSFVPMIKL